MDAIHGFEPDKSRENGEKRLCGLQFKIRIQVRRVDAERNMAYCGAGSHEPALAQAEPGPGTGRRAQAEHDMVKHFNPDLIFKVF